MRITSGALLVATGALHQLVGVFETRHELSRIWDAGIVASVSPDHPMSLAVHWFFLGGFFMMAVGAVFRHIELTLRQPLPAVAGVWLLGIAVVAIAPMPETGAWLLVPQAFLVFARAARSRPLAVEVALGHMLDDASHIDVKTAEVRGSMRAFIAGMLSYSPAWITVLYRVRAGFVRVLGMRQYVMPPQPTYSAATLPSVPGELAGFFTVRQSTDDVWAADVEEKHLRATIAVVRDPNESKCHVVTIVHYRHWTGPIYFNVIRPFHHLVVRAMVSAGTRVAATAR